VKQSGLIPVPKFSSFEDWEEIFFLFYCVREKYYFRLLVPRPIPGIF
jgi:hypothetical protein